jgi:hypothetical protein
MANQKARERVLDMLQPMFAPGEQVRMTTSARVGKWITGKAGASAILTSLATAGFLTVTTVPRGAWFVLTDKHLFLLPMPGQGRVIPKDASQATVLPLPLIAKRRPGFVVKRIELADPEGNPVAVATFGIPQRREATQLLTALGGTN